MHVLYNIAGFYRPAGMERVLAGKANWLAVHGHRVTILTTEQKGRPMAFPLADGIELLDLGIGYEDNNGRSLWNKLVHYPQKQRRHFKALKMLVHKMRPDIVVSMFCNEVNLIPRLKDSSRKVLEVHFSGKKRLQYARSGLWAFADRYRTWQDRRLAGRYDRFVLLTQQDSSNWHGLDNLRVIPNSIPFIPENASPLTAKTIVAVGRLTHQKGVERLIDAWSRLDRKEWHLRIVGDGELRDQLSSRVASAGLQGSVEMSGQTADMDMVYRNASVVALSSRYEGLPMVLLEAKAYGLPVVAFDCECGPREIINDGIDGYLVPEGDITAFADALQKLMDNPSLLSKMGTASRESARKWDENTIMGKWISLFQEIL